MARTTIKLLNPADDVQSTYGFAPLDDDLVAAQTDSGSFSRGRTYFRGRRIFNAVRRDNVLRARCHGSSGGPYLVEATLAPADWTKAKNPVSFSCTCPRGGFCKHVVALLLTWIDDPETFEPRPPVTELLASKSQEELIALILLLLRENPDLEDVLDLPVPLVGKPSVGPVDEAAIRRQIAAAMRDDGFGRYGHYDYDGYYSVAARVAGKLSPLVDLAETYAETGQWQSALRIYANLVESLAPKLTPLSIYDNNGDLHFIVARADQQLASCLDAQESLPAEQRLSPEERAQLIDVLLSIWQASIDAGGIDLAGEGPSAIARSATAEEQRRVGDWLRKSMRRGSSTDWHRSGQDQARLGFLSLLAGDAGLSDEELLAEYRNAELWDDATHLLLRMGRVDEAIALAARRLVAAAVLVPFADQMIATGDPRRIEQAISLVDDQLWEHEGQNVRDDEALRAWLERRYAEHGKPEKSLEMARERFDAAPSKATYDAAKASALLPGQANDLWPALRPTLIATLRKRGNWYALMDVYLEEEEIAEALKALERSKKAGRNEQVAWGYGWDTSRESYDTRVAAAAEADLPDEAIGIYRRLADQRIAARERVNYQAAAKHLFRVKQVLEERDRGEEWPPLITEVRQQNKSLRALREELDALGLR